MKEFEPTIKGGQNLHPDFVKYAKIKTVPLKEILVRDLKYSDPNEITLCRKADR